MHYWLQRIIQQLEGNWPGIGEGAHLAATMPHWPGHATSIQASLHVNLHASTQRKTQGTRYLDQKCVWEQNVSLCVNELGVSSCPDIVCHPCGHRTRWTIKKNEKPKNKNNQRKKTEHLPICMEISPMAQVALLHTEMNSGLRFRPRMGMNSAGGRWCNTSYKC